MRKVNQPQIIEASPIATINSGYVNLPYTQEGLKDFISGLLGKPQIIEKNILGIFDIDMTNLMSVYQLLEQRIRQQNKAMLVNFSAKIYYNNESFVVLNSLDELVTYNSVDQLVCKAIRLNWTYLIQFQDKEVPEKQEIDILFASDGVIKRRLKSASNVDFLDVPQEGGLITIHISHTARTWATDIESLLTNHFLSVINMNPGVKKILSKNSGWIALLFGFIFFSFIMYESLSALSHFAKSSTYEVNHLIDQTNVTINDKINYIISYVSEGKWILLYHKVALFLLIGLTLSIILSIFLNVLLDNLSFGRSFICINEATKKFKRTVAEESKSEWFKLGGTVLLSIICGIVANYIFLYLT